MAELTVGEHSPNYKTVDQRAAEAAKPTQDNSEPSTALRVANKSAKASFAASVALFVASIFGHGPADVAGGVKDVAVDTAHGTANAFDRMRTDLEHGTPQGPGSLPPSEKTTYK